MQTQEAPPPDPAPDPRQAFFDGLPLPACLVDADGRLVDMNPSALAFWGVDLDAVVGRPAMRALCIAPSDGGGELWARLSPPGARPRLACRIYVGNREVHPASIIYTPLGGTAPPLGALFIVQGVAADMLSDMPDWVLRDPVTGLGNRHLWERQATSWSRRGGCVVFFDLDDLKEVNDLYGHIAGDRLLAATGRVLAGLTPADALAVRYGGDEFVALLTATDTAAADAWAMCAVRRVAEAAASADLPIVPRLSHGVAVFGPGGLQEAVRRADDVLYERKGVLLPAASGGRIILTRDGRAGLRGPGDVPVRPRAGAFGSTFSPEFDAYLRTQFARAAAQAAAFVAFVHPEPGTAVVEVGAGSGRITFDGGLAELVGPSGQLLVTDPSGPQLVAARRRAQELGLDWLRFIRAPAEELPLASATVDLALGAFFLQFTDHARALRSLARVVRPGGMVAVSAGLPFEWPPIWLEILAPVREELDRCGLPLEHFFTPEDELRALLGSGGLRIDRCQVSAPDHLNFPQAEIAAAFWRQNGLVRLLLHRVPPDRHAKAQEAFEARLQEAFTRTSPEERCIEVRLWDVVATKVSSVADSRGRHGRGEIGSGPATVGETS